MKEGEVAHLKPKSSGVYFNRLRVTLHESCTVSNVADGTGSHQPFTLRSTYAVNAVGLGFIIKGLKVVAWNFPP
jgi:hypothetical protein